MDAARLDHLARTLGFRSRRALGVLPILGLAQKLGLQSHLVEDASAGNNNPHKGKVKCQGKWIRKCTGGSQLHADCLCYCPVGQRWSDYCDQCVPYGGCCPKEKLCAGLCIPKDECCDVTERTCQKKVKKKGKKKGKKTVNYCVEKPACCPNQSECPTDVTGCCTSLAEACTTIDGCCDIGQDKFTCDGKWCCRPDQKCCQGEGCVAKGSCCIADGACGDLLCCPPNTTCTVGTYNGQTRAHCCPPMPGQLGPCDGECCATPPELSMCCPGLSNPCRAIAVGCG